MERGFQVFNRDINGFSLDRPLLKASLKYVAARGIGSQTSYTTTL
jgi:hypothetical protein